MDFETILFENIGRDMYVKSVTINQEINENIFSQYSVTDSRNDNSWIIHSDAHEQVIELNRSAEIIKCDVGRKIPLITIHAQYRDILYYMYITDYISTEFN